LISVLLIAPVWNSAASTARKNCALTGGVANPALLWVAAATLAGLALALYVPQVSGLFRFVPLGITDLGLCVVAAGAGVLWFEAMKLIPYARRVMAS